MDTQNNQAGNMAVNGQPREDYIGKPEAARRLGIKLRTLDDWMRRGIVPYYKPGHFVRFLWSEIQTSLAQNCRVCRWSRTATGPSGRPQGR